MKKSNTAFLTTIFPSCREFLSSFFLSLSKQIDKDFDLIVVNDGVSDFKKIISVFSQLNIVELAPDINPVKNRIKGITYILNKNYKYLLFGDSDDLFDEKRILLTKEKLIDYDIVINEIIPFKNNVFEKELFGYFIKDKYNFKKHILSSNIFGLSNTGIKVKILKNISLNINDNIIAFDWFFYTILIFITSAKITFINNTYTFYRQHSQNTIGSRKLFNLDLLQKTIDIKKQNFTYLNNYFLSNNYSEYSIIFENELNKLNEIEKYFENTNNRENYLKKINTNIEFIYKGWWSQLISLSKLNKIEKYKEKYNENRN